jgi:hypothetical protein
MPKLADASGENTPVKIEVFNRVPDTDYLTKLKAMVIAKNFDSQIDKAAADIP